MAQLSLHEVYALQIFFLNYDGPRNICYKVELNPALATTNLKNNDANPGRLVDGNGA